LPVKKALAVLDPSRKRRRGDTVHDIGRLIRRITGKIAASAAEIEPIPSRHLAVIERLRIGGRLSRQWQSGKYRSAALAPITKPSQFGQRTVGRPICLLTVSMN
jgi:hypothetical protein